MKTILDRPTTGLYPVPVTLVTCKDSEGRENIITLAWNGVVASKPPTVSISVRPARYSHAMLTETKVFGMNIPNAALLTQVDYIGNHSGREVDKFQATGLTRIAAGIVDVSLIEECPVNLECRIVETFEQGSHTVFLGEVVAQHVSSEYLLAGQNIDYKKADPLLYCSGGGYFSLGEYRGDYGLSLKKKKD